MIVISRRCASHIAIADFPDAVAPQMTGIVALAAPAPRSASTEAALELIPREIDDRGASVHVVRRQLAFAQRDEERAHFHGRERVTRLDRGFACHRGRWMLMSRGAGGRAVAGERGERIAQASV